MAALLDLGSWVRHATRQVRRGGSVGMGDVKYSYNCTEL